MDDARLQVENPRGGSGLSRRDLFKTLTAAIATLELAGCKPSSADRIVPRVRDLAGIKAGVPVHYASALTHDGLANGTLVTAVDGRPIKVDGNLDHPFTQGGSDVFMQAGIFQLYDIDRSSSVRQGGRVSDWNAALAAFRPAFEALRAKGGEGLALLTPPTSSPSLIAQIEEMMAAQPNMRWYQYAAIGRDAIYDGTQQAFGMPLETRYRFDRARFVVALDGDFLDPGPHQVAYARDWIASRRASEAQGAVARLMAAAVTPTLTATKANQSIGVTQAELLTMALALEETLRDGRTQQNLSQEAHDWIASAAGGLKNHGAGAVVTVGAYQPAALHALAHHINDRLGAVGNTVVHHRSSLSSRHPRVGSLVQLTTAMQSGQVHCLIILGANPVYDAPRDLNIGSALTNVDLTIHANHYYDETASFCRWHVPLAHELECWSDARTLDGTASVIQPLIEPLFGGLSAAEILSRLTQDLPAKDYDLVRAYWRTQLGGSFDARWRDALIKGFIEGTAAPLEQPPLVAAASALPMPAATSGQLGLVIRPDPVLWDGSLANNPWLQELPRPLTKLVWGNAVMIARSLAQAQSISDGDEVEITAGRATVRGPAFVLPDQPDNTVTVHLGSGRTHAGKIGDRVGFDAYGLRRSDAPWTVSSVGLRKTGRTSMLAQTQEDISPSAEDRKRTEAALAKRAAQPKPLPSLYGDHPVEQGARAWGMVIDLDSCIGCNTCMIACQAENNIPVVGREEVIAGRAMHWIRVDRIETDGEEGAPFRPVPCMHCEHAPCEIGCPVGATVHDSEGLNAMVYNRCVGTRTCSAYCPYKVRRFNFRDYRAQETEGAEAQHNPDVTVRQRGVMEKCTYCVQRISAARIAADKENRPIQDGEVVTACQAACPARAITFGDLADTGSAVAHARQSGRHFALLEDLNTRPRTTYLSGIPRRSKT